MACNVLSKLIEKDGEILPVFFGEQKCAIFNALNYAENFNAFDIKCSTKNEWGDLQSLGFFEDKMDSVVLFKCQFEGFTGLFCNDVFKLAVEQAKLNGVNFSVDLGNIFPHDPSAQQPTRQ